MDPAGPVENAPRFPPPLGRRSRAAHRLHRPYDRSPRKGTGYNPRSTQARRYRQESEERRSAPMRRSECPEQAFRLAGMRTRPGMGTFFADRAPFVPAVERESALDSAIEALLIEAHTLGVAPEEIGICLSRKLEYFARARRERDGQST